MTISEQGFANGLLRLLNQRKAGTYSGVEEGAARLKQMLEGTDFDSDQSVDRFLISLMQSLRRDERPQRDHASTDLKSQLANGVTTLDLYDYVFALGFLVPIYNLRWDGKTAQTAFPG